MMECSSSSRTTIGGSSGDPVALLTVSVGYNEVTSLPFIGAFAVGAVGVPLALGDDVADLVWFEPEIKGDREGSNLAQRKGDLDKLAAAIEKVGNLIPFSDTKIQERIGQTVDSLVEFPVGESPLPENDGRFIGVFLHIA